jgi:hypothetical protein
MPLDTVENLLALPGPYELWELADGETRTLRIEDYAVGKAKINPRDGRPPHDIPVLRVFVPVADKPTLPQYWDITSQHLMAALLGALEAGGKPWPTFRVTWHGRGPRGRPSLETLPAAR